MKAISMSALLFFLIFHRLASLVAGEEQEPGDVGAGGVGAEGGELEEPQPGEVESVLTLTFGDYTKGYYTPLGLKLVFDEHQGVIQQTLQAHFRLDAVRIVSISSGVARRLQSDAPDPFSIHIRFFSTGAAAARSDLELARVLQAALSNAGAPITAISHGNSTFFVNKPIVFETVAVEVLSVLTFTFGDYTKGYYTPLGLKLVFDEHQGVIQQTLQAHFRLDAVRIAGISSGVARRLQSDAPDPFSIHIRFFSTGAAMARSDLELARVLQAALSNAGAPITAISHGNSTFFLNKPIVFETVSVAWGALQAFTTVESQHDDANESFHLVIGGIVAAVLSGAGMMFLGVWARKKCAQRKDVNKHQEKQAKGTPADPEITFHDAKKAEELENDSASTQSPSDGASDDTSSLEGFEGTHHPVIVNTESSATPPQGRDEKTISV